MDIQMPVMDGHEATRRIRADDRFRSLPVIAVTAHALYNEQKQILKSGMDAHMTKPIGGRPMLQVLGTFLGEQPACEPCPISHECSSGVLNALRMHSELDIAGALDRLAHTLKSSAGSIGAVELAFAARTLETAIEQDEPYSGSGGVLESCVAEMERLVTTLVRWLPPTRRSS